MASLAHNGVLGWDVTQNPSLGAPPPLHSTPTPPVLSFSSSGFPSLPTACWLVISVLSWRYCVGDGLVLVTVALLLLNARLPNLTPNTPQPARSATAMHVVFSHLPFSSPIRFRCQPRPPPAEGLCQIRTIVEEFVWARLRLCLRVRRLHLERLLR